MEWWAAKGGGATHAAEGNLILAVTEANIAFLTWSKSPSSSTWCCTPTIPPSGSSCGGTAVGDARGSIKRERYLSKKATSHGEIQQEQECGRELTGIWPRTVAENHSPRSYSTSVAVNSCFALAFRVAKSSESTTSCRVAPSAKTEN